MTVTEPRRAIRRSLAAAIAGAALAAAAPAAAATVVLNFDGISSIPTGYGDGAGVDVSYRSINVRTGEVANPDLFIWTTGYGDLTGVVYGGFGSIDYRSEILFTAKPGYEISLLSFDIGTYNRFSPSSPVSARTFGGQTLFSQVVGTNPGSHAHVDLNTDFASDGILLAWGPDGWNVGLDNIAFEVRAVSGGVPEPATWALMIAGFGGVGAMLRRRRNDALRLRPVGTLRP